MWVSASSNSGYSIGKVEAGKALGGVLRQVRIVTEVATQEFVPRERQSRTTEHGGDAHAKFQVGGGMETDLVAVNKRLRVEIRSH